MVDNFYIIEMLFLFLLASEFHLSYGLVQPLLGTFNFRQNCTVQHLNNKYKASCDGSKHFNTKIDLTKLTTLFLKFVSITVKENTRLYFEESSQLDVSTYNFLIQESYIYMFGQVNLSGYENSGYKKTLKILNSSVYGMKKGHIHIDGDVNEIDFIENGIYQSDISDIMVMIVETEGVTFTNNRFGCNNCTKRQFLQAKYLQLIGEQNFCDSTCNLTLTTYKELLDQGQICSRSESQVDDKTLCSSRSEPKHTESAPEYFLWILIIVIIISLVLLLMLSYFYCKRHSPRFRSMPVQNSIVPEALKLQSIQENPKVTARAFSNEVYERVKSDSDNIYEIVDSPTESR